MKYQYFVESMCCDTLASVGANAKPGLRVQISTAAPDSFNFPKRHRGIPALWEKKQKVQRPESPTSFFGWPVASAFIFLAMPLFVPHPSMGWRYSDDIPQLIGQIRHRLAEWVAHSKLDDLFLINKYIH